MEGIYRRMVFGETSNHIHLETESISKPRQEISAEDNILFIDGDIDAFAPSTGSEEDNREVSSHAVQSSDSEDDPYHQEGALVQVGTRVPAGRRSREIDPVSKTFYLRENDPHQPEDLVEVGTRVVNVAEERDHNPPGPIAVEGFQIDLPEDVVESIFSRVPFPQLFKAKVLSKSWYRKLPSLKYVRAMAFDEEESLLTQSTTSNHWFKHELVTASKKWATYCPVFVNVTRHEMLGYEQGAHRWRRIPIHHKIPLPRQEDEQNVNVHFLGPLMISYLNVGNAGDSTTGLVANPLTGNWITFPDFPTAFQASCIFKTHRGTSTGSDDLVYKIVVFDAGIYTAGYVRFFVRMLDPQSGTWSNEESIHETLVDEGDEDENTSFYFGDSAYLNGKMYFILWGSSVEVWQYDIERNMWTIGFLDFGGTATPFRQGKFGLYVVGSQLIMVQLLHHMADNPIIYLLDSQSLQPLEMRRAPWQVLAPVQGQTFYCYKFFSDAKCLYIMRQRFRNSVRANIYSFNIMTKEWRNIPIPRNLRYCEEFNPKKVASGSFEPRLLPD